VAKRSEAGGQVRTESESKVEAFAEDLGRLLGSARSRAEGWLGQRKAISESLEQIRDTATSLIGQLTGRGSAEGRGKRRGRPVGSGTTPKVRRRKRRVSAEARAKMAAAQRARWARVRAANKKK
jgi:hypothetical protein